MLGFGTTSKAVLLLAPALAGFVMGGRLTVQSESQLWVEGTSTVRSFKCAAAVIEADIPTTRPDAVAGVLVGDAVVSAGALRVPADRLDCRNNTMNDHMRKALKADAHPTITFTLGSYDLMVVEEIMKAEFVGSLTLGGTTRDVTINADIVSETAGVLRMKGSYDLRMTEYGLKPPSLMLGTMKVHDIVKVHFDLMLKN